MKDLSSQLTIFIIKAGNNPNYPACLQSIQNQSCSFTLDIIEDYTPMSVAFQQMLIRCKTPYYIEVDEDFILNKNTIEKMYNEFEGNRVSEKTAMQCYMLKDVHLNKDIYGIKIYKHNIFKNYPYNLQHPSCEVEQLKQIEIDGYNYKLIAEVVGEHSPHWNNELIFERYYNLMEKFKLFNYVWLEKLPEMLWSKIKQNPSELNMYAFLGALSSIFSNKTMDEEKNITIKRKDYGRIISFFDKPHQCTLYMSNACNFKCNFCYRQLQNLRPAEEMNVEIVKKVIDKFPEIKGICLCGFCEPLLNPNLVPILQLLKQANKYVGLITNGSLLKSKLNSLIGFHSPNYISVSLNAHNAEEHEKITETKTWDDVIEGIKCVLSSNIDLFVSSVVTTENLKYIPELLQMLKSIGVKTVHLHNLLPHFDETKNTDFWKYVLTTEHYEEIEKLKQLPESSIVKKFPVLIDKNGGKQKCQFPWYSFAVDGSGNLSICNSVLPTDGERFGNINDFVIWNSEKMKKFRDQFCNKELSFCQKCFRNYEWI